MKKNIWTTLVCLMVATTFTTPLLVDNACATEVYCVYWFDSYDTRIAWETNPQYMADPTSSTYASTTINGDMEYLDGNYCSGEGEEWNITGVLIRAKGYYTGNQRNIVLTPYRNEEYGDSYFFTPNNGTGGWSEWYNITEDWPTQTIWTWDEVMNLTCWVEASYGTGSFTLYCSIVELKVTFIVPD